MSYGTLRKGQSVHAMTDHTFDDDDDSLAESVVPGGCGDSNRFRPKPRVPILVGHLPRVSYVCLVSQSLKG